MSTPIWDGVVRDLGPTLAADPMNGWPITDITLAAGGWYCLGTFKEGPEID